MRPSGSLREGRPSRVDRDDTEVLYLEVVDEPVAIRGAWEDLERRLGSLRGRRFLGTFREGRYRAGVVPRDDDDAAALGLARGTIPGGRYLRVRLRGEPEELYARIPAAMDALSAGASLDHTRASIEAYRRVDEVDILVPILAG